MDTYTTFHILQYKIKKCVFIVGPKNHFHDHFVLNL